MAKQPNYKFERQERDRLKKAKKGQKAAAKEALKEDRKAPPPSPDSSAPKED